MKKAIWFILLLILANGCATKPVAPKIYSTGDTGVYMNMQTGKGISIGFLYTMDTVATGSLYSFEYEVKEYSKEGNTYSKLESIRKFENGNTAKYRIENGNAIVRETTWYSSENFIKEYSFFKNFFELLSPDFKNMNNAERVKVLDSLAQIDW
ncbi:MAG: hypothetical protein V4642_09660 [Bacteroidota bacterium]